jgi:hypothetical protein
VVFEAVRQDVDAVGCERRGDRVAVLGIVASAAERETDA